VCLDPRDCLDPIPLSLIGGYLIFAVLIIMWARFLGLQHFEQPCGHPAYKLVVFLALLVFIAPVLALTAPLILLFVAMDATWLWSPCVPREHSWKPINPNAPILLDEKTDPFLSSLQGLCSLLCIMYLSITTCFVNIVPQMIFLSATLIVLFASFMYWDNFWHPLRLKIIGGNDPSVLLPMATTPISLAEFHSIHTCSWGGKMVLFNTDPSAANWMVAICALYIGQVVHNQSELKRILTETLHWEIIHKTETDDFPQRMIWVGFGLVYAVCAIGLAFLFKLFQGGNMVLIWVGLTVGTVMIQLVAWVYLWWSYGRVTIYLNPHFIRPKLPDLPEIADGKQPYTKYQTF